MSHFVKAPRVRILGAKWLCLSLRRRKSKCTFSTTRSVRTSPETSPLSPTISLSKPSNGGIFLLFSLIYVLYLVILLETSNGLFFFSFSFFFFLFFYCLLPEVSYTMNSCYSSSVAAYICMFLPIPNNVCFF